MSSPSHHSQHVRRWILVGIWTAVIFLFSTGPFGGEGTSRILLPLFAALFPHATPGQLVLIHAAVRKAAHFLEYLVLSILLYRALRAGQHTRLGAAAIAFVVSGLYAVTDELHQLFVPGRTAAAADCLIDVSGAAAGQGLLAALGRGTRR